MLKRNLILFFRNIKRDKTSFLINLIGLSTGLACAILIYLWVNDELNVDKFHEKDANLFQLMEVMEFPEKKVVGEHTSGMIAPLLLEEMPEIEYAVQVWKHLDNSTVSVDEKAIKADGISASQDFFKVFTFPLIVGDKTNIWAKTNSIMISESLANKFFDSVSESLGQTINLQNKTK